MNKRGGKGTVTGKKLKQLNGRSMPYLDHLKENMSITYPNNWVVDQVREKYGASSHYSHVEQDALNIGIACRKSIIIISFCIVLTHILHL